MPDNFYGSVVIPKIQGDYGKISFLKPLSNKLFDDGASPDIASYINGSWFDTSFRPIARGQLKHLIFADTDTVVCKLDRSYQGRGVYQFSKKDFHHDVVEKRGNCIIQKFIQQHQFFSDFISDSVATIRLTTVIDNDHTISLRSAYLRLGRSNDTHVKSVNHIRVPVGLEDGKLYDEAYLPNWQTIAMHPDSKVPFSNTTIPHYQKCVQLVLALHKSMPMVRSIGWDVIVNQENRPVLMEWNGYSNDIKFSEATQGPCFKDLKWDQLK